MKYYTQLVFVAPDQVPRFHDFEERVLPLLHRYGGRVLLRWRRTPGTVVESEVGDPYELHIITFPTEDDFIGYVNDDTRRSLLHLADGAVERVVLLEGTRLA